MYIQDAFYSVHEVLMASILGGLPFAPPVDHILSELSYDPSVLDGLTRQGS